MFVFPMSTANNMGLIVAENKSLEQVRGKGSHTSLENFLTQRRKGRKVSGAKT
jgi:hypothetical protein